MKKLIALCLSFVFIMSLVGCSQENEKANSQYFFTAKVIEVHEEYLLLEVCDTNNSNLSAETKVEVSTNVISADGCPAFVANEYAKVLLAKNIDDNPADRLEALAIHKTDKTGMIIAD